MTPPLLPKPNVYSMSLSGRVLSLILFKVALPSKTSKNPLIYINITKVRSSSLRFPLTPPLTLPVLPLPSPDLWVLNFFCFWENENRCFNTTNIMCSGVRALMYRTTNNPGDLVQTLGSDILVASSPCPALFNLTRHRLVLVDNHLFILIINFYTLTLPTIRIYHFLPTVCQPIFTWPSKKIFRRWYLLQIDFPFVVTRKL